MLNYQVEPDLNNYTEDGYYDTTSFNPANYQHVPSGINLGNEAVLRVRRIYGAASLIEQILFINETGAYYVRRKRNEWGDWRQVYDTSLLTNSTLLSPLAAALGGVGINKFVFVPTVYNLTNAYAEIIANINAAYPNASSSIFMGRFTKGTEGFYILYTYGNNGQQEYPEYSVGMLMQWAGETISSFGTVSQVPYSRSVSLTTT